MYVYLLFVAGASRVLDAAPSRAACVVLGNGVDWGGGATPDSANEMDSVSSSEKLTATR